MSDLATVVWQILVGAAFVGAALLVIASFVMAFETMVNGRDLSRPSRIIGWACVLGWALFVSWLLGALITATNR